MKLMREKSAIGQAKALLRLLQEEKRLLLNGAFGKLEAANAAIEAASDELSKQTFSDDVELVTILQKIRDAAAHNQRLSHASQRGVADAKRKLAEIETARSRLHTYSNTGQSRTIASGGSRIEKRF